MGSATARRTTSASLAATGWVRVSALPRSFTVTTAHSYNFLKNTKVRLILQVASDDGCIRRACFFNDLCESTKVVGELQGWGLLKRWFVVEKWVWPFSQDLSQTTLMALKAQLTRIRRIGRNFHPKGGSDGFGDEAQVG